ncbi:hypothetical protein [Variovorax sp. GT1P44]|uniref:hypothetical protein n=1 Tax=Variovorax sp. GT1P44 TaxID=3443742 RepID=UPI003F4889A6
MKLLHVIASSHLPMSFNRTEDIEKVRILRAAGLVIAFVPGAGDPFVMCGPERAAQVVAITQRGREELIRVQYPEPAPSVPVWPSPAQFLRSAAERARRALR